MSFSAEAQKIVLGYFIEKALENVLGNLAEFAQSVVQSDGNGPVDFTQVLPSVCVVGLGRCGSNIAVGVSSLVFEARQKVEINSTDDEDGSADRGRDAI